MRSGSEAAVYFGRPLLLALLIANGALASSADRADQAPATVRPLELKQGLWEIHLNVATSGMIPRPSPETIRALTAAMTPEQRRDYVAELQARQDKAEQEAKRGRDRTGLICPLSQDFETRIEANPQAERCTRTIRSTGQELHLRLACASLDGVAATEQDSDFERIDSENFRGTIQVTTRGERTVIITETYLGHWRAESCPDPSPTHAVQHGAKP
jgi:hypothetical protein